MSATEYLWNPLLEATGQALAGAIGTFALGAIASRFHRQNTFDGPMDLWQRGILGKTVDEGDSIYMDCQISPYAQLFPGNPFNNSERWNTIHEFPGRINKNEYQAMEFYSGSDAALRVGAINGESIAGLYHRYGFIGDGLVGIVPTKLLQQRLPEFFNPKFSGARAMVIGKLSRGPSQHGFVARGIAAKAGIDIDFSQYRHIWYLQIHAIKLFRYSHQTGVSLLGSHWAVTEAAAEQYLVQYGYINNELERDRCVDKITASKSWKKACVYFDDISSPSAELSFKKQYIL